MKNIYFLIVALFIANSLSAQSNMNIPYTDDFESTNYWFNDTIQNQWERGTPSSTNISSAHSGTNVWAIDLNGQYANNSYDILYSPIFAIPSNLDTAYIKFWHYIDCESDDGGFIQWKMGPNSWVTLGYIGEPNTTNWYNTNIGGQHMWSQLNSGWQYSTYMFDFNGGTFNGVDTLEFRFRFYSNSSGTNRDGWAIDDFEFSIPTIPNDVGISSIISPIDSTQSGSNYNVAVEIKNYGTANQTSIPVSYTIGNNTTVNDTFIPSGAGLAPNTSQVFTFNTNYVSPSTDYNVCINTNLPGDVYTMNDKKCKSVHSTQLLMPSFTTSSNNLSSPPFNISFTNTSNGFNSYTWNFGDGTVSLQKNPTHTYQYNGMYQVMLLATDTVTSFSNTAIQTITCTGGANNPCSFTPELTQSQSAAQICYGDSVRLSATPMANITYAWTYNGAVIPNASDSIFYAKNQGFYMAVLSNSSCSRTTSDYFVLAVYPHSNPQVSVIGSIAPCSDDSLMLQAAAGYSFYQWNNGKSGQSIYIKNSGDYSVNAINSYGCKNLSQETIINVSLADIPKICAVSVDGNTNHNVIKWQAQTTNKIDSFRVYCESSIANQYDYIGGVAYNDPYEVEDPNSNVSKRQYAYKITAIDTCGKESPVSLKHKTMHLLINEAINNHWNLFWKPYEGFSFASYNIYRGTDSLNMALLATVPSSVTSYSDLSNPSGDIYYQIEVVSTDPCGAKSYGTSRSNNFNTKFASGLGISTISDSGLSMKLFPNPNHGNFSLEIKSTNNKPQTYSLEVYNMMGALIHSEELRVTQSLSKQMQFEHLSKGVYFINLRTQDEVLTARFIVQ